MTDKSRQQIGTRYLKMPNSKLVKIVIFLPNIYKKFLTKLLK